MSSIVMRALAFGMMLAALWPTWASAALVRDGGARVALVIGNDAYRQAPALPSPANDATAMANALKRLGFEVSTIRNGTRTATQDAMAASPFFFGSVSGDPIVMKAAAESPRQVALLIGNGNYAHATKLNNPGNDVTAVGKALEAIGFTVTVEKDLDTAATKTALRRFRMAAANADAAVIYFAGQGFLRDGKSYLPAVDARLATANDLATVDTLDAFTDSVGSATNLRLVIADICQHDPLTDSTTDTSAAHRLDRGTIALLSASPGQEALDGEGQLSPFAEALAQRLATSERDIWTLARQVREDVLTKTQGKQEPRLYGLGTKSLRVFLDGR